MFLSDTDKVFLEMNYLLEIEFCINFVFLSRIILNYTIGGLEKISSSTWVICRWSCLLPPANLKS